MDAGYRHDDSGLAARERDAEAAWRARLAQLPPRALPTLVARRGRVAYANAMGACAAGSIVSLLVPVMGMIILGGSSVSVLIASLGALASVVLALTAPLVGVIASARVRRRAALRLGAALDEVSAPLADRLARSDRLSAARPLALAKRAVGDDEARSAAWSLLGFGATLVWLQLVGMVAIVALASDRHDLLVGTLVIFAALELLAAAIVSRGLRSRIRAGAIGPGGPRRGWLPVIAIAAGLLLALTAPPLTAPLVFAGLLALARRVVIDRLVRERELLVDDAAAAP